MKFELGEVVVTSNVSVMLNENKKFEKEVMESIDKYSNCDWGDTCEEDKNTNDYAVDHEERIVAIYDTCMGKILIITEWDRSCTTVLFPYEY